jgi:hypothetical protein
MILHVVGSASSMYLSKLGHYPKKADHVRCTVACSTSAGKLIPRLPAGTQTNKVLWFFLSRKNRFLKKY